MNGTVIKKFLAVRQVIKNSRLYLLLEQIFYRKQSLGAPEQLQLLLVLSDSMFQKAYSRARSLSDPCFFVPRFLRTSRSTIWKPRNRLVLWGSKWLQSSVLIRLWAGVSVSVCYKVCVRRIEMIKGEGLGNTRSFRSLLEGNFVTGKLTYKLTALFYVSLNSIYCIVVSSLLFSPSIYKSCFVICLQLPPPRLVHKLFAGGKVM